MLDPVNWSTHEPIACRCSRVADEERIEELLSVNDGSSSEAADMNSCIDNYCPSSVAIKQSTADSSSPATDLLPVSRI